MQVPVSQRQASWDLAWHHIVSPCYILLVAAITNPSKYKGREIGFILDRQWQSSGKTCGIRNIAGTILGKYSLLTEYICHEDKKLCMFCSLFGSLVSGRTDSQKCPGNFCWMNEQMAVRKTWDLSNALFYGRRSWDPLKRMDLHKGKAGTGPEIPASSLVFSPHPKICLSWMKFLGKSESKNHIMIQCLAIMTNFGAPGDFLEVTTILPTNISTINCYLLRDLWECTLFIEIAGNGENNYHRTDRPWLDPVRFRLSYIVRCQWTKCCDILEGSLIAFWIRFQAIWTKKKSCMGLLMEFYAAHVQCMFRK